MVKPTKGWLAFYHCEPVISKGLSEGILIWIRTTPAAPPWFAASLACVIGAASQSRATGAWAGEALGGLLECDRRQSDAVRTYRMEVAFRLWGCGCLSGNAVIFGFHSGQYPQ